MSSPQTVKAKIESLPFKQNRTVVLIVGTSRYDEVVQYDCSV